MQGSGGGAMHRAWIITRPQHSPEYDGYRLEQAFGGGMLIYRPHR
jgi:hypothetical protein